MKNINVKKIVAGAAALALGVGVLGAAIAANNSGTTFGSVAKTDIYNTTTMVPKVHLVTGVAGQVSDTTWAQGIAAAIADNAKKINPAYESWVAPAAEGGTTVISEDGYLSDNYEINAVATTKTIDETDYSMLYKKDTSADSDHAGASTLTIYDELTVTGNIWFNTDKDVKDLVASIDKGAITYTVDFDEGIKNDYTDAGASPRLKFNLMGQNYTVESYGGTTLKLVQNLATQTFTEGAQFTADDYTIQVVQILDTGAETNRYEVEMNLKDSTGAVKATDVFRSGDTKIFDEYLTANIDIDTVYSASIKVVMGSSGKLEIKNGSKITDFPNKDDKLWKSTFTTSLDGNYLTGLTLTTDDSSLRFTNDDSLKVGDKIELPLGFGSVEFLGLTEEKSAEFEIKNNYIYFKDEDRKEHEIFLYDLDEATTARDTYTSPQIDGKSLYFTFYTSTDAGDANFTVQLDDSDGKYLIEGVEDGTAATWGTTQTFYGGTASDLNADTVATSYTLEIPMYNNQDRLVEYTVFMVPGTSNKYSTVRTVGMGLTDAQTKPLYIGDTDYRWDIAGIDVDGTNTTAFVDAADFIGGRITTGTDVFANDEFESLARIKVYNGTDKNIYAYIDSYTGDMVNLNDNDFTDTYKQMDYSDGTNTFELDDKGNTTSLEFGYTTYGAYVSIEDGYPMLTLPERQLKGQLFIGGASTTTGGTDPAENPYDQYIMTAVDEEALVVTDAVNVADTAIVVGGHIVNNLAVGVTENYLTQTGDHVMGKYGGKIFVAGYTAADTGTAAQALIDAINSW